MNSIYRRTNALLRYHTKNASGGRSANASGAGDEGDGGGAAGIPERNSLDDLRIPRIEYLFNLRATIQSRSMLKPSLRNNNNNVQRYMVKYRVSLARIALKSHRVSTRQLLAALVWRQTNIPPALELHPEKRM